MQIFRNWAHNLTMKRVEVVALPLLDVFYFALSKFFFLNTVACGQVDNTVAIDLVSTLYVATEGGNLFSRTAKHA